MPNTNKFVSSVDYGISFLGITYSLDNIKEILGIIILILSIINLLYKMILNITHHIKNKNYDKISNEFEVTIENLKDMEDKYNE